MRRLVVAAHVPLGRTSFNSLKDSSPANSSSITTVRLRQGSRQDIWGAELSTSLLYALSCVSKVSAPVA